MTTAEKKYQIYKRDDNVAPLPKPGARGPLFEKLAAKFSLVMDLATQFHHTKVSAMDRVVVTLTDVRRTAEQAAKDNLDKHSGVFQEDTPFGKEVIGSHFAFVAQNERLAKLWFALVHFEVLIAASVARVTILDRQVSNRARDAALALHRESSDWIYSHDNDNLAQAIEMVDALVNEQSKAYSELSELEPVFQGIYVDMLERLEPLVEALN